MSRNVWFDSSRLAVRNGRRLPTAASELVVDDPDGGQRAHGRAVLQRQPDRSGPQGHLARRGTQVVVDQRQVLPLLGRLTRHVDELRGVGHRLEHDDEGGRQLQRQERLLAGRQFDRVEGDLLHRCLQAVLGQVDAAAPEDLAVIFPERKLVGTVRRDPPHARIHREAHLDHVVERRLVVEIAEGAVILLGAHALERRIGVEHAAAARAEHVPRHVQKADLAGLQERRDRPLFVEPFVAGKVEHVDARQLAIGRIAHKSFKRGDTIGISRLPQNCKQ